MRRLLLAAGLALTVLPIGGAAFGHHSTAMFDLERTVTVRGKVESFEWTNPHTWIWLEVPNAAGGVDRYGIEGMSPNYLSRIGWSRKSLEPGAEVAVEINPLKDGRHGGFCVAVTLADGKVLRIRGAPG